MAAGGHVDFNAVVAAGDTAGNNIRDIQEQLKQLKSQKKAKAAELKKEKMKRERLMQKASKNLTVTELGSVLATKVAKANAKAAAKAAAAPPTAAASGHGGAAPAGDVDA